MFGSSNLFKNTNSTQTSTGIFGGTGSGLTTNQIGQSNQQSESLWGGGGNKQPGNLFGQPTGTGVVQGLPQTSGSTGTTQTQSNPGIFGNTRGSTGIGTTSLFFSNQPNNSNTFPKPSGLQTSGNLGGVSSGGIFGGFPQQTQQTGNIIGQQPFQGQQGGIFGQTQQGQQQGGILGQTQQGGIFCQPQQVQQQAGIYCGNPLQQTIQAGLITKHPQTGFQGIGQGLGQKANNTQTSIFSSGNTTTTGVYGSTQGIGSTTTGSVFQQAGTSQTGQQFGGIGNFIVQKNVSGTNYTKYQSTKSQEQTTVNNTTKLENVYLQSLTAMKEFANKTLEELRYEDYLNKKQGLYNKNIINMGTTSTSSGLFPSNTQTTLGGQTVLQKPFFGSVGTGTNLINSFGFKSQPTTTPQIGGIFQGQSSTQKEGLFPTTGSIFASSNQQPSTKLQQPQVGGFFQQKQGGIFQNLGTQQPTGLTFLPSTSPTNNIITQPTLQLGGPTLQPGMTGGLSSQQGIGTGGKLFSGTQTGSIFGGQIGAGINQPATTTSSLFAKQTPQSFFSGTTQAPNTTVMPTLGTQPTNLLGQGYFGIMSSGENPQPGIFTTGTTVPTQQYSITTTPLYTPESVEYKNYFFSTMPKERSITDILNDLQRQYYEQDFFNDEIQKERRNREINLGESKYSQVPIFSDNLYSYDGFYDFKGKNQLFDTFLKSKRIYKNTYKTYINGSKVPFREREKEQYQKQYTSSRKTNLLDFETEKTEKLKDIKEELKSGKKSHSCDLTKKNEQVNVIGLENSFIQKVKIEDENSKNLRQKKMSENTLLDLYICLQEPIKTSFSLKINKNSKLSVLKSSIVDHLKDRFPKYFKKLNINDFVLMKTYSILKDSSILYEAEIKDGDSIHILLKENYNTNKDNNKGEDEHQQKYQNNRKDSKNQKKKKKDELASLDKLPILTKSGYRTIPDFRNFFRMNISELEQVENFSIYNEYGRIDFEGFTNLTNINLDQIVNIEEKKLTVYQNADLDFKPPVGQGLNKPAVLHLYDCFPNDVNKKINDEQWKIYLASLQKICKDKGAEFKSYDKNTGEWIFRVEHFC